jgi:DNA invertase Pin-like site-specific DNA recombinase
LARHHRFGSVDVINDDLGRSASGSIAHPGFKRLVAEVCTGEVDTVLCLDASRLSRNGRDWHAKSALAMGGRCPHVEDR